MLYKEGAPRFEGIPDEVSAPPGTEKAFQPSEMEWPERGMAPKYNHPVFEAGYADAEANWPYYQTHGDTSVTGLEKQMEMLRDSIEQLRAGNYTLESDRVQKLFGELYFWYEKRNLG